MGKTGEMFLFVLAGFALVGLFFFFPSFKPTGNVIFNDEYKVNLGDSLSYNLSFSAPEGIATDPNTPILISLSKDGKVIDSKVLSLKELSADNKGIYSINAGDVINSTFNETGEYELYFAIFKFDVIQNIKITAE